MIDAKQVNKEVEEKRIEKGEDPKVEKPNVERPMRQILIETNGDMINLKKAEVNGKIELIAILESMVQFLSKNK